MAATEDDLRKLSGLLERIAAREVDAAIRDAVQAVRPRAVRVVRDLLASELTERLVDRPRDGPSLAVVPEERPPRHAGPDVVDLTGAERRVSNGRALYVYALTDADVDVDPKGGPVPEARLVRQGRLAALVRPVDTDQLAAADADALAQLARGHDQVVTWLAERRDVVPFRFGTVRRDEDDVRRMLAEHGATFGAILERLRGKEEWGVRMEVDGGALDREVERRVDEAAGAGAAGAGGPGTAYMARRRVERRAREETLGALRYLASGAHARVAAFAVDSVVTPARAGTILSASYLVDRDGRGAFLEVVREVEEGARNAGVEFHLSGPWPAYSFASVDDTSDGGSSVEEDQPSRA